MMKLETIEACRRANVSTERNRARVMCPDCSMGGAQHLESVKPKCHICTHRPHMQPASNDKIECTWEELQEYLGDKV